MSPVEGLRGCSLLGLMGLCVDLLPAWPGRNTGARALLRTTAKAVSAQSLEGRRQHLHFRTALGDCGSQRGYSHGERLLLTVEGLEELFAILKGQQLLQGDQIIAARSEAALWSTGLQPLDHLIEMGPQALLQSRTDAWQRLQAIYVSVKLVAPAQAMACLLYTSPSPRDS